MSFLGLSPDLHRCIGLSCPEIVPQLSQTCSYLYRNLSPIYNQCSLKIQFKKKEGNDSWRIEGYNNFAIFQSSNTSYHALYRINQLHLSIMLTLGDRNSFSITGGKTTPLPYTYRSRNIFDGVSYNDPSTSYTYSPCDIFDIRVTRRLLLKRLGCIQKNPHYVRETLLTDLDSRYSNSRGNNFDLFSLYIYLYVNMLIIGKVHGCILCFRTYDSNEIASLESIIRADCLYLYETLRSHYLK